MAKVLALDTSTNACSAALSFADITIERYELAPQQHAKLILPMVQSLLTEAKLQLAQLDAIAFGCGPGSFTGVRIATGIVQGLAFGAGLPVVPISSLQALAQGAYEDLGAKKVLAGFDARMQEIYWGQYQLNNDGFMVAVTEDALSDPKQVTIPKEKDWVAVGDAWQNFAEALQVTPDRYPHARDIAKLAVRAYKSNKTVAAENALPVYLRSEKAWEK